MRNMTMEPEGVSVAQAEQVRPVANATVPYWRTEPHPIDQLWSTPHLPQHVDIVIIGAGLTGVSTAYHITKQAGVDQPSICLLDARQVCAGATGRNGGHVKIKSTTIRELTEKHGLEAAESLAAFVRNQIYALKGVVQAEHLDCEFELRRSFDIFCNRSEADAAVDGFVKSSSAKEHWTADVDLVRGHVEQITSVKDALAAISSPIASFWPYKFVSQLLARLVDQGRVNLQTNTPVLSVEQEESGDSVINTSRGTIRATKLVYATNAYTSGLCPAYRNVIVPYIGTACHITPRNGPISPHLSNTYNINYAEGDRVDYLNPRPDGGIVVGGGNWTFKHDLKRWYNNFDDSQQFPEVRPHFDGLMQRHFKGWENSGAEVDRIWTGVQGLTSDALPHVGVVPGSHGRQYISAGFNGGGNAFCFLCAEGIAKMLVKGVSYEQTDLPRIFETNAERLRNRNR